VKTPDPSLAPHGIYEAKSQAEWEADPDFGGWGVETVKRSSRTTRFVGTWRDALSACASYGYDEARIVAMSKHDRYQPIGVWAYPSA
jgi:hypothetical protein